MNQKNLSRWLKSIIMGLGICGLVLYAQIFPLVAREMGHNVISFQSYTLIWLVFIWVSGIPCFICLYYGWKITQEIEQNHSFSSNVVKWLTNISVISAVDTAFFFAGSMIFYLLGALNLQYLFLSLFGVFIGVTVAVSMALLSHLTYNVLRIKEENELTI